MILRPPRATRTDTLFPYTTLCRSASGGAGRGADLPDPRRRQSERRRCGAGDAAVGAPPSVRRGGKKAAGRGRMTLPSRNVTGYVILRPRPEAPAGDGKHGRATGREEVGQSGKCQGVWDSRNKNT